MLSSLLLVACSGMENNEDTSTVQEQEEMEESVNGGSETEVTATNLEVPWEIVEFNDTIYVSERPGSITKVTADGVTRKSVKLEKSLANRSEAGLLGLAFPSSFSENKEAFAYYSYANEQGVFQRIVRIQEQSEQWVETAVLVDGIPGGQYHQGGRIEIGPDDKLYATTGDATVPNLAQNKDSLAGKILRINQDGTIPNDNPFADSYIYSIGHRNPQGLAWDEKGNLYATEHGNQAHDEINLVQPGNNYGWPEIEGDQQASEMLSPVVQSGNDTWAPSGTTFYNGDFYFASLRGEAVRKFDVVSESQEVVLDGYGRIRDVLATDEGIYFVTNNTDGRGNPIEQDDRLILWKQN
ncbi:quinoprotein glucose dehydrogenase [Aquibacillus halophilus]|uniref:Quinoprotein glucose dehydrogenase n=2 Tax=Aquibacillus halophilus TaxID=930132 RepID=A0A6A8DIP5_9BACI|nr:PQQ-dependent sugar dehydrogenase [Aquibacillus halophilus]MRH43669.1 quinoprotein glucose dehydrogenase [Aquibacillus halophilus]